MAPHRVRQLRRRYAMLREKLFGRGIHPGLKRGFYADQSCTVQSIETRSWYPG